MADAFEELISGLEEEAELKEKRIRDNAEKKIQEIMEKAEEDAGRIEDEQTSKATVNLKNEQAKIMNEAKFYLNREMAAYKEKLLGKVFKKVEEELLDLKKNRAEYKKALKSLLRETIEELPGEYVFEASDEKALTMELLKEIGAREKYSDDELSAVADKLSKMRKKPKYEELIRELMEKTKKSSSEKIIVNVPPEDKELMEEILKEENIDFSIRTELESSGGLQVLTGDGSITLTNTFESRLSRIKEKMREQLYSLLFGE